MCELGSGTGELGSGTSEFGVGRVNWEVGRVKLGSRRGDKRSEMG